MSIMTNANSNSNGNHREDVKVFSNRDTGGDDMNADEGLGDYNNKGGDFENPVHDDSLAGIDLVAQERAAVRIQSAHRGRIVRKKVAGELASPRKLYDTTAIFIALEAQTDVRRRSKDDNKHSISPNRRERLAWDVFMLILVVYSSVDGPYVVAFLPTSEMTAGDWLIDLCFYADIVLNFFTGFDKGFEVVMDRAQITKHYVEGWFLIDLIATIEWDLIYSAMNDGEDGGAAIGMVRLLKVLRLARASRLINRLVASWAVHTAFIDASKFLFYVGMACHLLACFFFMWPDLGECDRDIMSEPLTIPTSEVELAAWQIGAVGGPSEDDVLSLADGVGWYKYATCLQGSWRQGYSLEAVCDIRDSSGSYQQQPWSPAALDTLLDCYISTANNPSQKMALGHVDGPEILVREVCRPCMPPREQYIDSVYWSLTTMTTIGYGDRGPQTAFEIQFVMFAEVFGLCVFALLLQQINKIGDVIGETDDKANDEKNGVVSFLKDELGEGEELINDTIRFLNFRAAALSGHSFHADDSKFNMLSPGLISKIQTTVYRPVLERVRFFGWNPDDAEENQTVQTLFEKIDVDGDGTVTMEETNALLQELKVELEPGQLKQCFLEMDRNGNNSVKLEEFQHWWFLKKTGKPRIDRCPTEFLNVLCTKLKTQPFAIKEEIVKPGDYGKALVIILTGSVQVNRNLEADGMVEIGPDGVERDISPEIVSAEDREPAFGYAACLSHAQWRHIGNNTFDWTVETTTYVDTAWVHRADIVSCFLQTWPQGQAQMEEVAFAHYEITEPPHDLFQTSTLEDERRYALEQRQLPPEAPEWARELNEHNTARMAALSKAQEAMDEKLNRLLDHLQVPPPPPPADADADSNPDGGADAAAASDSF